MRRLLRRRWPAALAAIGLLLLATAGVVAVARGEGSTLGPDGVIQVGGLGPGDAVRSASTPVLAVDPEDPKRVLLANRIERPRFGCDVFWSGDGGTTWKRSRFARPRVGHACYSASVAFAARGRALLFLSMLAGPGNHPVAGFVYESDDGGASFTRRRRVLPRSGFQPGFAAAGETAAVVALHANEFSSHVNLAVGPLPNPIAVRVSGDGGRTFAPLTPVQNARAARIGGPAAAVGQDGAVHVLYWDYGDDVFSYHAFPGRYGGRFRLVLATSTDGGRTFAHRTVASEVVPPRPFLVYLPPVPALAVHPKDGTLYAVWEDRRSGSSDVLLASSSDRGTSWTSPRVLFGGKSDEHTPAVTLAPDGRLVALAYRLAEGARGDVIVRSSKDAGETFSAPAALTPSSFDASIAPRVAGRPAEIDLGSRLGLAAAGGLTLAAWTDTRTGTSDSGKADIVVARVPDELPEAVALPPAATPPPARPPVADRRLKGPCTSGTRVDSRQSPEAVLRSFLSALDEGDLARAYGYLDRSWKLGRSPAGIPHPFQRFSAELGSLTCVRPARIEGMGEEGWFTMNAWVAVRRSGGPTRLLIGTFWAQGRDGRPPWRLMGYWTHEFSRRLPPASGPGKSGTVARWIELTLGEIAGHRMNPPRAARALALVSVALDRALRSNADPSAAAAPVLGYLFPDGAQEFAALAGSQMERRTTVEGRKIGESVVAGAREDGSSAAWVGRIPVGAALWKPQSRALVHQPLEPLAGSWRPWVLPSGSAFRPKPPTPARSPAFEGEVREVLRVSAGLSAAQRRLAEFWADGSGTATPPGHWNSIALELIREHKLSARPAARMLAVLNMAQADAFIAAWDAKYAYWSERPITAIRRRLDPAWLPYLVTPPFPSYVSGHATTSGAASEVLAHFFPSEAAELRRKAREAAMSRLYGGIHFRSDNEQGLALGRKVAAAVLAEHG